MKIKDIYSDIKTRIFVVLNQDDDNILDWVIEPTSLELLPEDENTYFVKAFQVSADATVDCYLSILTPERVAETVVKMNSNGNLVVENWCEQNQSVIPAVASDCFGNYDLYFAKENPQVGIDVLRDGLAKAQNKNVVAEDLGYLLRDENVILEAIEAFKISELNGPSSAYIYLELSNLYKQLGQADLESTYLQKFKDDIGTE
ncbi:M48 family metallopeptidase [Parasegetibacter sp. NRK P23]|uniref:tetratricopeptide repeat protein n=1 Tax=Parasegetibacter sp. NRK P23 TaxID=2942999 RepID=UPI0020441B22|nr:hypothetical protein [Parasegetibacter sp. NRK P23]MCM5530264.1 hypothetical protein [Parasegetibacter sp. NRK P23]